jgi:hypothetical protein
MTAVELAGAGLVSTRRLYNPDTVYLVRPPNHSRRRTLMSNHKARWVDRRLLDISEP